MTQTAVTDAADALQPLNDTVAFLRLHAPYSALSETVLKQLLGNASLALVSAETNISELNSGIPKQIYVLYQGLISVQIGNAENTTRFQLGVGDTLYASAAFEQRASRARYRAERDSFLLQIPTHDFLAVAHSEQALSRYCQRRAGELVDEALKNQQQHAVNSLASCEDLDLALRKFCDKSVVSCSAEASVRDAVKTMHEHGVGSIVIETDQRVVGIFTLQDLRRLVAESTVDLDANIDQVMSQNPVCLSPADSGFEAIALMMANKFRHIPIVEDQRLIGLVSERDLFSLQRGSLVQLARQLVAANSVNELAHSRSQLQAAVLQMLAHGASARQLIALITELNDMAVKRCIELVTGKTPWPTPILWLSFGSEGRSEQTLATDQDNGLVLLGDAGREDKDRCLALSSGINQALDDIGFPLCRGNTMACNPELCLSVEEWRERFDNIIRSPSRQHLLDATIVFDARVIVGDEARWQHLMREVQALAADAAAFLHALAQHALEWKSGLNMLGQLRGKKQHGHRILDIKKFAIQPLVAAVRVYAIRHQIAATNTLDRLEQLARGKHLRAADVKAWQEALSFLQMQRLHLNQQQLADGQALSNDLDLSTLNALDRRILKEAIRQIERLQQRLKLDFPAA